MHLLGRRFKPFHLVSGIQHNGVDAYPRFREIFTDPAVYTKPDYFGKGVKLDQVEVEMLKRFGYFTSGSEGHIPQYTSYSASVRNWWKSTN